MSSRFIKLGFVLLSLVSIPMQGFGKELPSRVKMLKADMKKCEQSVKKFASLGYPAKAEKQLLECKRIKGELAKIEKSKAAIDRKLASLDESHKKAHQPVKAHKKLKREHKRLHKRHH